MLQAQQRAGSRAQPRGGRTAAAGGGGSTAVGARTSSDADLMSRSTANRKALLGQSYYDDAKK